MGSCRACGIRDGIFFSGKRLCVTLKVRGLEWRMGAREAGCDLWKDQCICNSGCACRALQSGVSSFVVLRPLTGPFTSWTSALPLSCGSSPVWVSFTPMALHGKSLNPEWCLYLALQIIFTELALCSPQDHPDGLVALSLLRFEEIECHRASEILKNS